MQKDFSPTGCLSVVVLNRVVIGLSSAVRSMVLLSTVRHDGYYFLTLWTVGDSGLCLWGLHCAAESCQLSITASVCTSVSSGGTVILNLPLRDVYSFPLLSQIVVILWVLVMCRLLQRRKGYGGWKSKGGWSLLNSDFVCLSKSVTLEHSLNSVGV